MPSSKKRQLQRLKRSAAEASKTLGENSTQNNSIDEDADDEVVTCSKGVVKFLNQLFSENRSHAHRLAAVEVMSDQLDHIPADDIYAQSLNWTTHLMKIIESTKIGSPCELALTCHTLSQLLILSSRSADLKRVISLNVVPKLLSSLLDIQTSGDEQTVSLVAVINLMKICMKYYGGSCLSFKNKLEAYALRVVLSQMDHHATLEETCLSTLSYLPVCGGQGATGTKHSEMWSNQMARIIHAISTLIGYLFTPCDIPASAVECKEAIPGQAIKSNQKCIKRAHKSIIKQDSEGFCKILEPQPLIEWLATSTYI